MRGFIVAALVASGCSPSHHELGTVSPAAEAALREWCPRLEAKTRTAEDNKRDPIARGRPTENLRCPIEMDKPADEWEEGNVTLDRETRRLLMLNVSVSSKSFDLLVDQVLNPALDSETRAALRDVRAALQGAAKGAKHEWRRGGIFVSGEVSNPAIPIWSLMVGPDLSK